MIGLLYMNSAQGSAAKVISGSVTRNYAYDQYGMPTGRSAQTQSAGTYMNFEYNFNATTGNLNYRKDVTRNITENFSYDNLNRLTGFGGQTVTYDPKGNITQKSGIGNYHYLNNAKPYALTGIVQSGNVIPERQQQISYASFSRPLTITEDGYTAQFIYEAGGDRVKMQVTKNGVAELTRHYLANQYELDEKPGSTREKLYLGGDYYSAGAVLVRDNGGAWQVFYINSDYLGSETHVVNSAGSVIAEYSYDAWGRLRNPVTHAVYGDGQQPELFLGRGYTGHEHLNWFGLINMNARLYDPVHGRFLAPDPYVQAPDFTQSFNRYGYAFNNPLSYVDPSGEIVWFVPVIIGAVIGAYTGASLQSGTLAFWNWKPDAWKGAIAGAIIGATVGYGVAGLIGATGMTTTVTTASGATANVTTKTAGLISLMLNSGSINIGVNALSHGGWDGAWKAGLVGLATGGWNASCGFGMVKAFGAKSTIGKFAGKLGYQIVGTAGNSIGNNWVRGDALLSKVNIGVGPVNFTIGKGQKLLQWQNNIGNMAMNAFGLLNTAFGGKMSFDWGNLSMNYRGGLIDRLYDPASGWASGFSPYAVTGNSNLSSVCSHELHHLWQSRAFNNMYLFNYGLQGLNALLMGGSFLNEYNFYEDLAYGEYWW